MEGGVTQKPRPRAGVGGHAGGVSGGVVWHGRSADLLARTRGQVAIAIYQLLEQLGPALTPLHD